MKPLREGDHVSVRSLHNSYPGGRVWQWIVIDPKNFKDDDEGISWARGWDTQAALALRAAVALENCVGG